MREEIRPNTLVIQSFLCDQAWTVQRITSHYQNKMSTLRRILNIYQGKVEKKSVDCERRVAVSDVHLSPSNPTRPCPVFCS